MNKNNPSDLDSNKIRSRPCATLASTWQWGLLVLIVVSLSRCTLLPGGNDDRVQTSVAETVMAQAPSPTLPPGASPTLPPTATVPPTEAAVASETAAASLVPTLTPIPFTPVFPTLAPTSSSAGCCNLRVRNQNNLVTLWIGTTLPYGGNFIQPLHYVEFYPGRETWMRIFWCRRIDHKNWPPEAMDDFEDHWRNELRYYCQHRDVLVDEPMKEISVH